MSILFNKNNVLQYKQLPPVTSMNASLFFKTFFTVNFLYDPQVSVCAFLLWWRIKPTEQIYLILWFR